MQEANKESGPGPGEDENSKLWIYHGHRGEVADIYAGNFGAILVIAEGAENYDEESLLPTDGVDEMFLYFSVMDEGGSFHLDENIARMAGNKNLSEAQIESLKANDDFAESNLMHAINGYMYCAGPLPFKQLTLNRPTRMYMYSLGSIVDMHSVSLGNEAQLLVEGTRKGSAKLLAGTFTSAIVRPMHTGALELRCSIDDHIGAGMRMLVNVTEEEGPSPYDATNPEDNHFVTHYIAAELVDWDYAKSGMNQCTKQPFGEEEDVFVQAGAQTPGSRYVKAMYVEYEGPDFKTRRVDGRSNFSGIVGPLLSFEVGDNVTVVFLNKNVPFAVDLNIVGLVREDHSCAPDAGVELGEEAVYEWTVPESSGPGRNDLSSIAYVYYSSVDSITHTHAGLAGVVSVTNRGGLNRGTRVPKGSDMIVPLLFNIFRENASPLLTESLKKFATGNTTADELEDLEGDDDWLESNAMHAANGYLYCNNPLLNFETGAVVRFIVFGFGSEASMHAPFFDGQTILGTSRRGAGVQVFPYSAETVDVAMASRGEFVAGCVIADHRAGGMQVRISNK